MQTKEKDNIIFIRLYPGEEINQGIIDVCKKHKLNTAVIISGIGQLKGVKLGYFKEKGDYLPDNFDNPTELISLSGNICKNDDEYITHMHSAIGTKEKAVLGGHLIQGIVSVTAEIVILKTDIDISRKLDDETGLMSLNLK